MIRMELAKARHAEALERLPELLRPVLDLHKPTPDDSTCNSAYAGCEGCDWGTYAEYAPEWPCTTWKFLTK